ncbi:alkaline phosphatase family protein [Dyella sp. 2HG41-7]|uniref:alkaline phosphatase family protein n=1 Tax=Dyella sp. 2HG41-7 TaxID=2883239 RepID=UPI001F461D6E|nr:alkaline phosphatase family protein [Dyella sp. 2HG41-7]
MHDLRKSYVRNMLATACLAALFASPAFAANSGNLLLNGNGEAGTCTTDWSAVNTVPGWTVTQGNPSTVCYSIGSFSTPGGTSGGNAFIADGPYGDSALRQNVDVSNAASAIDGGNITYALSGWLGGYTTYNGQAIVTAVFLDANGKPLGAPAQLAGVNASARNDKTGFVAQSTNGNVPAGTRSISVLLQFNNTSGSYNVGYADNLSLTLSTQVTAPTLQAPVSQVPTFDHVFMVMMENTDYSEVIGDTTDAPFINSLANQGVLLDNYSGVYHPSDENYLAIAGGDTFVKGAIYYPNIKVTSQHIGDELEAAGKTWKAYEQGMGTPCNTSNNNDSYYEPDDAPFINFTDISTNSVRCAAHLFDTTQLSTDLQSASTTPNFAWIAADDYYDGESSGNGSAQSLQVQNGWLQQTLQPIFNSPAWTQQRSLLILTWDESASSTGNHVATLVLGSPGTVQAGYVSNTSYNHFSVGRTIENALGIAPLTHNDQYAQPINDAFVSTSAATTPSLSSSMPSVAQGTYMHVDYATPASKLNSENWIGIYASGKSPGNGASTSWQYAPNGSGTATFDTSGLAPGTYNVWYCYNNGYTELAGPITLIVTAP